MTPGELSACNESSPESLSSEKHDAALVSRQCQKFAVAGAAAEVAHGYDVEAFRPELGEHAAVQILVGISSCRRGAELDVLQ